MQIVQQVRFLYHQKVPNEKETLFKHFNDVKIHGELICVSYFLVDSICILWVYIGLRIGCV